MAGRGLYLCVFLIGYAILIYFVEASYPQENDRRRARALGREAGRLVHQGRYEDAVPFAEKVLEITEEAFGPEHPAVARSLGKLAMIYFFLGNYPKAKSLHERALLVSEKVFGSETPAVAKSLNGLALLHWAVGDYSRAESLYKRALEIREKILGPEHPEVAKSLHGLAVLYWAVGDYEKAEVLHKRALAISQKAYDSQHPLVARSLNGLAMLYYSVGDYDKAKYLYERSQEINENAFGKQHPHVAWNLHGLAEIDSTLGDYENATRLFKRALEIREHSLGPEHPLTARSLNGLAGVYRTLGDYDKAEPLHKRALEISERTAGPEHPLTARCLNSVALFYRRLGYYAKAEPLYKRSLEISEKALGPEHPLVASILNGLAGIYRSLRDYNKAKPLYARALKINEKALGMEHREVAASLNDMALLYWALGDYDMAEPLYKRSLAINEKVLGREHREIAVNLNNLGLLYAYRGDFAKAEPLYRRSLEISENALGPEHPVGVWSLNNLAQLYAAMGNPEEAFHLFKRAQGIDNKLIDQVMGFTSEEQKIQFISSIRWRLDVFLSLVNRYLFKQASARIDALNVWLRRKGVILEAQKRFQAALVYSDDPEGLKTIQELSKIRARVSKLTFVGPGKSGLSAYQRKIADLEVQKNRLEARLSQLSKAFAVKEKIAKADSEKLAKVLPANTVLIEFAKVRMFNFKARGGAKRWLPAHYLAFVLHAGKGDKVGLIDLGGADKIDAAVSGFKRDIVEQVDKEGYEAIRSSQAIYNLVFDPLRAELGGVKEIFISPDGSLNLIPFEVLQGPDGRYLIEDYTFNYLATGRDLLGFGHVESSGEKTLLMGDPDFDMRENKKESALRKLALGDIKGKDIAERSVDMKGLHFNRLPGTRIEVRAVRNLLGVEKTELYTGEEALEEVIRKRSNPKILHLATHGFFLEDLDLPDFLDETLGRGIHLASTAPEERRKQIKIENPLLRSGIALAGANHALKSEDAEQGDGIVTAEKILALRLRGTDMVVLSACETGVGEVKTGEGVFGLRRAFTQAGAKSLVMSMWSVPDLETRELMVAFYGNLISKGMNRCQALRQAAIHEMEIVKERYGTTNPFFWGAFVFMGEP